MTPSTTTTTPTKRRASRSKTKHKNVKPNNKRNTKNNKPIKRSKSQSTSKTTTKTSSSSSSRASWTDYKCSLWSIVEQKHGEMIEEIVRGAAIVATINEDDDNNNTRDVMFTNIILPSELYQFIPNMIEFYLMMYERQNIFCSQKDTTTNCEKQKQFTITNTSNNNNHHNYPNKNYRNPIMKTYHFCNNYRELDRGTAYFRSQILDLYLDMTAELKTKHQQQKGVKSSSTSASQLPSSLSISRLEWTQQVLAMSYVYRLCNRIESFSCSDNPVGGIPRLGEFDHNFVSYVRSFQNSSRTTKGAFFTSAHQTTNYNKFIEWCQDATYTNPSTIITLAKDILSHVGTNPDDDDDFNFKKTVCELLCKYLKGVKDFFAWQILCDLEETRCFSSSGGGGTNTNDTFCLLGPGAKSGLDDIFGTDPRIRSKFTPLELCRYLRDNIDPCLQVVELTFPYWRDRPCTLKMIEHALCEMNKFYRLDTNKSNLRKWKSRAPVMDQNKPCQSCGCIVVATQAHSHQMGITIKCDSCHAMFCANCSSLSSSSSSSIVERSKNGYGMCARCKELDQWCPV